MSLVAATVAIGFLLGIPALGPAAAMSYRRLLTGETRSGLGLAAGYILADGLACLAAVWGADFVLEAWPEARRVLRWVGVALVGGLGVYFVWAGVGSRPVDRETVQDGGWLHHVGLGFGMTAFNPSLWAGWTTTTGAVLAAAGVQLAPWQKLAVPAAIVVGELAWYVACAGAVARWREALTPRLADRLVRGLGGLLLAAAAWSVLETVPMP